MIGADPDPREGVNLFGSVEGIRGMKMDGNPESAVFGPVEWEAKAAPLAGRVYAFVAKTMNYVEEAADVTQETLTRAYRYRHAWDRQRPLLAWMLGIASHEIHRFWKKHRHWDALNVEVPAGAGEGSEQIRMLHQMAARLPGLQREVFFLHYQYGFSVEEMAGILDCPSGTVKRRLWQARDRLRREVMA